MKVRRREHNGTDLGIIGVHVSNDVFLKVKQHIEERSGISATF